MNTTSRKFKNLSMCLLAVCLFVFSFVLIGCTSTLWTFSRLEKKSMENGTIAVGAARVTKYDNNELDLSRSRLIKSLNAMREDIKDMNHLVPQFYGADFKSQMLTVFFGLYLDKFRGDFNQHETSGLSDPCALYNLFHSIIGSGPRPSEIELVGLRLAALKFVESQIEDLNLTKFYPVPSDYNRIVIGLDLTAWVTGKAKAALVYVDLYPYKAEDWCYTMAKSINNEVQLNITKSQESAKISEPNRNDWKDDLFKLKGFDFTSADVNRFKSLGTVLDRKIELKVKEDKKSIFLDPNKDIYKYMAAYYRWLEEEKLLPHIVQVERMSPGEYSMLTQGDYSSWDIQGGGAFSSQLAGGVRVAGSTKKERMMAKVRPLNLAFVAGERRAGWLFMPSQAEQGKMPPTERTLKIVIDVPENLKKLTVHVHKIFLDSELQIISDTDFAHQMENLKKNLNLLAELGSLYKVPEYEKEPMLCHLITTRMLNLLYQGWSEEMALDVPPEIKPPELPKPPPPPPGWWCRFVKSFHDHIDKDLKK